MKILQSIALLGIAWSHTNINLNVNAFVSPNLKFNSFSPLYESKNSFGRRSTPLKVSTDFDIDASSDTTKSSSSSSSPFTPVGSKNSWEVHKFGGASLATAELYRTVGDLLIKEAAGRDDGTIPTMAIVSARGGMTDLLVKVVDSALLDFEQATVALDEAVESQITLLKELAPPSITDPIEDRFRQDGKDILSVVQSLRMLSTVPAVTMEVVTGFGEIWSAQTLHAYLQTTGVICDWIDARDILVVKSDSFGLGEKGAASTGGVTPLYEETAAKMSDWFKNTPVTSEDIDYSKEAPIVVVTGFVAKTLDGVPTTLKRSGSDYSATIFAKLVDAGRVTMWKNTNGVYTADPRRVPEAFPIKSLKYDEAMELAYFGAQVLHPSAMEPCIAGNIPVYVRNIFNPAFEGTVIQGRSPTLNEAVTTSVVKNWKSKRGDVPIKGITSVDKTALVTLEGASIIGGTNVAERFMGAMAGSDITVLIITQASSESSITVAVPENEGEKALRALQDTFELELSRSTVNSVSISNGMSIVAIVGEGMALTSGVSATFMSSLSRANCNIRLIAQGSSERQVAVVVSKEDASRALRAAHMAFTLSETTASVAILGSTGFVGTALMSQIEAQDDILREQSGVHLCVNIAANSKKMSICENSNGLNKWDLNQLPLLLESEKATDLDLDEITNLMEADVNPLRVIIDCTSSNAVVDYYERWLKSGINVIGPNKNVAAGDLDRYERVCQAQKDNSVFWQYESIIGAALPICTTLRDLIETGDRVTKISGCVSASMAYVLSSFSDEIPFSQAVNDAVKDELTENDLRDDFSGRNTAEKVVILARLLGMDINIDDVEIESIIPDDIMSKEITGDRDAMNKILLEDIKSMDGPMLDRLNAAKQNDCVLRYKFIIDKEEGTAKCWLESVNRTHPLYRLKLNENLVAFETNRYATSPLIVKGKMSLSSCFTNFVFRNFNLISRCLWLTFFHCYTIICLGAAGGPDLSAAGIFADLLRLTRAYDPSA